MGLRLDRDASMGPRSGGARNGGNRFGVEFFSSGFNGAALRGGAEYGDGAKALAAFRGFNGAALRGGAESGRFRPHFWGAPKLQWGRAPGGRGIRRLLR